jgi:general secretion pathway protein E
MNDPAPGFQSTPRSSRMMREMLRERLVEDGLLTKEQVQELDRQHQMRGQPPDRFLIEKGWLPEDVVLDLLSSISGIPRRSDREPLPARSLIAAVPSRTGLAYRVVPVAWSGEALVLVSDSVHDIGEEDELRLSLGFALNWMLCSRRALDALLRQCYGVGAAAFLPSGDPAHPAAEPPSINRFISYMLEDALGSGSTDVHLEPGEDGLRLRYRVDGVLLDVPLPSEAIQSGKAVVSAIKVRAQLDVAEHRLPQDGRFDVAFGGGTVDFRVSILPGRHGEGANLRLLHRKTTFIELEGLGLGSSQRDALRSKLRLPHGLILLTGPTGAGKTTTLYACLALLNRTENKIITLEDPVEYVLPGLTQIQINPKIGLSFAAGLRSVLRHDPDVVMVGEIRDAETAAIAVSASLTGHLVFSTLHTNDSAGAIPRLLDMGIEPYLVASSIEAVVAQRLVRCICHRCKVEQPISNSLAAEVRALYRNPPENMQFFRGTGCPDCRFTGYHGRRAIYEVLDMTDDLRALAAERAPGPVLLDRARKLGLVTLRQSGWACALLGQTTIEEVLRVTHHISPAIP